MRKPVVIVASAVLALLGSEVRAQQQAWVPPPVKAGQAMSEARWLFGANYGFQIGSNDLSYQAVFPLYDEQAVINASQTLEGGSFFDVSAGYRMGRTFGVALAWHTLQNTGDADLTGSLPHPIYFDRPREFTATATELDYDEQAFHVQALWFVQLSDKLDVAISGGPSFFRMNQQFVRAVAFTEQPPDYASVTVESVLVDDLTDNAVGFNAGADFTYAVTSKLGAGVQLRYSRATATFDTGEGQTADVTGGGFQVAGGVRFRF